MIVFPQPSLKINLARSRAGKPKGPTSGKRNKRGKNSLKSYNGLFEHMLDHDNIVTAIEDAAKGKTTRKVVQRVLADKDRKADVIAATIRAGDWKPPIHEPSRLQEGAHRKARMIVKPRWDDEQIVHHMVADQLIPIVMPRLYRHVYGSIPSRGTHAAMSTMRRWVKSYGNKRFYVAELDIRKFYQSVDHYILMDALRKRIRDKRYLAFIEQIIEPYEGLPLGFYTSPWLANYMLLPMDNWILQQLKPDHYLRYMDNIYLLHTNKRQLHEMVKSIQTYMSECLHLEMKGNWQVFRFEKGGKGRAIDCLGFIIHRDRVTLRKRILQRIRHRALRIRRSHRLPWTAASAIISLMGYIWHSDTYGYYRRYIRPCVMVQACKRRISRHQKGLNRRR